MLLVLSCHGSHSQTEGVISDKHKVLHHHPDKRRARGLAVKEGEDDYFTCITRGKILLPKYI